MSQGDSVRANDLLLLELESERRDLFNCFTHASQYYKDRYSGIAQIQAFAAWIVHWLQRICWGYGLRLRNLVTTIVVLLVALSAITYNVGGIYHIASESKDRSLNVFESAYVTTITFCTVGYGDITPASGIGRSCSMITAVIGVVAWGFLVAAVYRRLAR
ncbi:MAG TPA: potassium channel family protein [Polyangiaceae bacterium]